jgi:hypothetical protein
MVVALLALGLPRLDVRNADSTHPVMGVIDPRDEVIFVADHLTEIASAVSDGHLLTHSSLPTFAKTQRRFSFV